MYKIIEHLHVKPGKGAAFVRTKLKNLSNGGNLEKTFRAGEVVDGADLTKTELQFNDMDGGDFVFMNMESFETETVKGDTVGEQARHADRARMPRAANANLGRDPDTIQRSPYKSMAAPYVPASLS